MYAIFLDEEYTTGDYAEYVGCAKTRGDADLVIQKAVSYLKKCRERVEPEKGWTTECFTKTKMLRSGIMGDWVENLRV